MRSWTTFKTKPKWGDIQSKPTILADNQISWGEIQGIPERINFLASNIPQNWHPWVLSDFYGERIEWLPLVTAPNPYTMVQRDGDGWIRANGITAVVPDNTSELTAGDFYRDSNGFVKVVM